ncbi:MAG: SDR family NAD(P)-dependent oxidoreductase [Chlamydiae bacterium]|nr:SDR family NAD(P)-dependent oxidoreductase [Chlamydiota bacterium]MBI3266517.1 SDR family NAD(P)-dependent oxidoreductase [Chlamydiota bacterium]
MISDKVFIITGASSGIGKSCVLQFLTLGGKVCAVARSKEGLEVLKKEAGLHAENILVCPADVTKEEDSARVVHATIEKFGKVDVLVNNAGIGLFRSSWETSLDEYQKVMNVNFFGALLLTLKVLPSLRSQDRGQIVNVISVAGRRAFPDVAAYCASKFALRGFSEALRQELKRVKSPVQVSLVYPVATNTPFFEKAGSSDYRGRHRFTNIMQPGEVAKEILKIIEKGKGDSILTRRARVIDKIHAFFPEWIEDLNLKALEKACHPVK